MTYFPTPIERSIFGAEGLNCCVRNGNRCDPLAMVTGKSFPNLEAGARRGIATRGGHRTHAPGAAGRTVCPVQI